MGETAIAWTARRRHDLLSPRDCLHREAFALHGSCIDTGCARCWEPGFTVNPWIGCVEKTPACANCYAKTTAENRMGLDVWGKNKPRLLRAAVASRELVRIHRRAGRTGQRVGVFSGSMCDVFEDREDLVAARQTYLSFVKGASNVDVMLLTKRPENIARLAPWPLDRWPKHVWAGATIAGPGEEDFAIHLAVLKAHGVTTFASVEPMLGTGPKPGNWLRSIDVVIIGGESGPDSRPFDEEAARKLVDACDIFGANVFFKQMGSVWAHRHGGALRKGASHGQDPYRWPAWAQRRELPEGRA